jgi:hypothetical protein
MEIHSGIVIVGASRSLNARSTGTAPTFPVRGRTECRLGTKGRGRFGVDRR